MSVATIDTDFRYLIGRRYDAEAALKDPDCQTHIQNIAQAIVTGSSDIQQRLSKLAKDFKLAILTKAIELDGRNAISCLDDQTAATLLGTQAAFKKAIYQFYYHFEGEKLTLHSAHLTQEQLAEFFANVPAEIKPLVKSLDLSRCHNLADLTCLREFPNVETLDVSQCRRLQSLEGIRNLTSLTASECNGLSNISALANCRAMTQLDLSHCDRLIPSNFAIFADVTALNVLRLKGIQMLSGVDLSMLTSLKELDLTDSNVEWDQVKHIGGVVILDRTPAERGRPNAGKAV